MNNSNNQRSSTPPPPPSYDESQREANIRNSQNNYQQPSAPQTSSFTQSTPNANLCNTGASSAPHFNMHPSQPSVPSAPSIPSAPPQTYQQTWPPMDTIEKKVTRVENKLTKAIDKLDCTFDLTGTSKWESNFAYHQNRTECMFSGQSSNIESEMDKFEKQCSTQGDKFMKDVDELSSKWSSSWDPQSLSSCAQSKMCECSYNDRGISCGSECKKYPVASTSSSNSADPNYYDNSMRKN